MKQEQLKKYGIGSFIVDCILFADILIDICAGKLTADKLLVLLSISLLLAIPMVIIIMGKMRKGRNPSKLRNTEKKTNLFNTEDTE